jgi:hypothetical protein
MSTPVRSTCLWLTFCRLRHKRIGFKHRLVLKAFNRCHHRAPSSMRVTGRAARREAESGQRRCVAGQGRDHKVMNAPLDQPGGKGVTQIVGTQVINLGSHARGGEPFLDGFPSVRRRDRSPASISRRLATHACLRMVLSGLVLDLTEARLRELCDCSPLFGTDAMRTVEAARAVSASQALPRSRPMTCCT